MYMIRLRDSSCFAATDGQSMIETRNGSDDVLKSRRSGIRGTQYVDELLQTGINDDPATAPGLPSETLAGYSCDALGTIVTEEFPTPGVKLDYFQGTRKSKTRKSENPGNRWLSPISRPTRD